MLETCETWDWQLVGEGFVEGYLAVNAVADLEDDWQPGTRRCSLMRTREQVVKLKRIDDCEAVIISIYSQVNAARGSHYCSCEIWVQTPFRHSPQGPPYKRWGQSTAGTHGGAR